jgi:hypothetical protein
MPTTLVDMLKCFNGGKLFFRAGPLVSIFGISMIPPLPSLQWAPDWFVDKFTPKWRLTADDRRDDWAIAMMNYGGLIILDKDDRIREWDTSQRLWSPKPWGFDEWVEDILRDGDAYMKD